MYLFLEYCSGGELFDRIGETHNYFLLKVSCLNGVNVFQLCLKNLMWGCQKGMLTGFSCN